MSQHDSLIPWVQWLNSILQKTVSVHSGTTPLDAAATPPRDMSDVWSTNGLQRNPAALSYSTTGPNVNSPPQAIAGVPDLAEGGLPGLGMDPASHDCIALGSLDGQIDVHSIEEQSGEVQKVCLPSVLLSELHLR
jgi:hypothetical protein